MRTFTEQRKARAYQVSGLVFASVERQTPGERLQRIQTLLERLPSPCVERLASAALEVLESAS